MLHYYQEAWLGTDCNNEYMNCKDCCGISCWRHHIFRIFGFKNETQLRSCGWHIFGQRLKTSTKQLENHAGNVSAPSVHHWIVLSTYVFTREERLLIGRELRHTQDYCKFCSDFVANSLTTNVLSSLCNNLSYFKTGFILVTCDKTTSPFNSFCRKQFCRSSPSRSK